MTIEATQTSGIRRRAAIRCGFAILTFAVTTVTVFIVVGIWGAGRAFSLADRLFPAISAVTPNTNTTYPFNGLTQWFLCPALSLFAGVVAGALVWDTSVSLRTERLLLVLGMAVLGGVSGVNFWAHDALINIKAQALIDFALAFVSISVLVLLVRWTPVRTSAIGARGISVFAVTMFGLLLPTWYGTVYLLQALGVDETGFGTLDSWIKGVGAVLALAVTAVTLKKPSKD